MSLKGLFITFEGIDGCGKSTQVERAFKRMSLLNRSVVVTREPGGTKLSEKIRSLVLSPENAVMTDATEVLLYLASRAQHVGEKILPAIKSGTVVLCDRFQEATFAYQGWGRGIDLDTLKHLNSFATLGLTPDYTFIFDLPVETAFDRMKKTGKAPDRLEQNAPDFYIRVRNGYLAQAALFPERIALIDATKPADDVETIVLQHLESIINRNNKL
jgi:dTMP kinase